MRMAERDGRPCRNPATKIRLTREQRLPWPGITVRDCAAGVSRALRPRCPSLGRLSARGRRFATGTRSILDRYTLPLS
jgi:hypothetical protein